MTKPLDSQSYHHVTTLHGAMVSYGPDDLIGKSLEWYGEWAANEINFLTHFIHEGDTVVDIGAHIGCHTRAFSERVGATGHVHAIEANPLSQHLLLRNIELSPHPNISAHLFALGPLNNRVGFGHSEVHNSGHFSVNPNLPQSTDLSAPLPIPIRSFDSLGLSGIRMIKIDVEGAEVAVLQGSLATIAKNRPFIFCEANSAEAVTSLFTLATTIGYSAYKVVANAFNPHNFKGQTQSFFNGATETGVFLSPIERSHEVEGLIATTALDGISISRLSHSDDRDTEDFPDFEHRPLYIAVSFYKSPDLIDFILDGLLDLKSELLSLNASILLYNDSPDHLETAAAFDLAAKQYAHQLPAFFCNNLQNLGFIGTMNLAFDRAKRDGADLLLLNSDAMPARGAITELLAVSRIDPMLGFVCPRSNNATIASIGSEIASDITKSDMHYLESSLRPSLRALPRFQYSPTAIGFGLLVKFIVIDNFGSLSPDYGMGYNEENDYIMRAGQAGYRSAIANWAYCFHAGEKSFSGTMFSKNAAEKANAQLLNTRYPEYRRLVHDYATSHRIMAERFLSTLSERRVKFAIDATMLFRGHNGTIFLNIKLIQNISRLYGDSLDICLIGEASTLQFHGLNGLKGVRLAPINTLEKFDIALRIGQPFSLDSVARMDQMAAVNIYFMLDTIAQDCVQLQSKAVDEIWKFVADSADGIIFNSHFTKNQFRLRYINKAVRSDSIVSHHSLSVAEYAVGSREDAQRPDHCGRILIIGNHFPHKAVVSTYMALASNFPSLTYSIVGGDRDDTLISGRNDIWLKSGDMSEETMNSLYTECDVVVFPSHYEGFGFPILNALAAHKPVFVRDNAISREIMEAVGSSNIYLYKSEQHLLSMISQLPSWIDEDTEFSLQTWEGSAVEIVNFCLKKLNTVSIEAIAARASGVNKLMSDNLRSDKLGERNVSVQGFTEPSLAKLELQNIRMLVYVLGIKRTMFAFSKRKRRHYARMRKIAKYKLATLTALYSDVVGGS